jgi:hypothetical protein
MTAMFINIIPEFRHDQAVQRLMVASTSSNLSAVVDMLMLGISLEDISVPPAAAEYARRFAQHDLSLEALLRAYYQTERQRWEERSDATHIAQVRAVLATEGLTTSMAEQMLGLPLRGWHIHGSVSEGVVETVIPARRREGTRSTPADQHGTSLWGCHSVPRAA